MLVGPQARPVPFSAILYKPVRSSSNDNICIILQYSSLCVLTFCLLCPVTVDLNKSCFFSCIGVGKPKRRRGQQNNGGEQFYFWCHGASFVKIISHNLQSKVSRCGPITIPKRCHFTLAFLSKSSRLACTRYHGETPLTVLGILHYFSSAITPPSHLDKATVGKQRFRWNCCKRVYQNVLWKHAG